MRTSESALWLVEEAEPASVEPATAETDEDRRSRKWERVAIVGTIFIGFQFALLAVLGL